MNVVSIRGAITVEQNTVESILSNTKELLYEIEVRNDIDKDKVISIIFTATSDLDKVYPARAAREMGYIHNGLMCFNEMVVEGSLDKCIRIMILYNSKKNQKDVTHVYLKGATTLRPDLTI